MTLLHRIELKWDEYLASAYTKGLAQGDVLVSKDMMLTIANEIDISAGITIEDVAAGDTGNDGMISKEEFVAYHTFRSNL